MGTTQSVNASTLITHAHKHSVTLLEWYKQANRSQRLLVWLTTAIAIQRINKHNLIGMQIYVILQLLSLPLRHILEVIFMTRDDEQNLMKLSIREQFVHDMLRYIFLYLPIPTQRKLFTRFAAVANRRHNKKVLDRVYLHETNNPYSRDVYVDWYGGAANLTEQTKVILFAHGGAYVFGNSQQYPAAWNHMINSLQQHGITDVRVCSLNYRLSPESKMPAPIVDGLEAYDYLLNTAKVKPHNIIIAGDSAGGNLALSVTIQIRETGRPFPAGVVLLSPWLDAKEIDEPYFDYQFRDYLCRIYTEDISTSYFGHKDRTNIVGSPGLADCENLPPILCWYAEQEMLGRQCMEWKDRVKSIKSIQFISNRKLYHVAPLLADLIGNSARDDLDQIILWMKQCFDGASADKSVNSREKIKYTKEMLAVIDDKRD